MATTTPGSNVLNYPLFQNGADLRQGVVEMLVRIVFSANSIISTVSAPVPISVASAAAGIWNFTVPSGYGLELAGQPVNYPVATNTAPPAWAVANRVATTGKFDLYRWAENASGTLVTGVSPASGDAISFKLYIHSSLDGAMP